VVVSSAAVRLQDVAPSTVAASNIAATVHTKSLFAREFFMVVVPFNPHVCRENMADDGGHGIG
jgi:hypothetical protein